MNLKLIGLVLIIFLMAACSSGRKKSNSNASQISAFQEPAVSITQKESKSITSDKKVLKMNMANKPMIVFENITDWCDHNTDICFYLGNGLKTISAVYGYTNFIFFNEKDGKQIEVQMYLKNDFTYKIETKLIYNALNNLPIAFWDYENPSDPIAYDPNNAELQKLMPVTSITEKTHNIQSQSISQMQDVRSAQTVQILSRPQTTGKSILK